VRTFENVGAGYYPNSVFIHMDTRETSGYWIDYSGPGEKPIYAPRGMTDEQLSTIRANRRTKKAKSLVSTTEPEPDKPLETIAAGTKINKS
jgi:hypothetical protein